MSEPQPKSQATSGGKRVMLVCPGCGQTRERRYDGNRQQANQCRTCARAQKVDGGPSKQHPLYITWFQMLQRCRQPKSASWKNYGARGIRVCAEWHSFPAFVAWAHTAGWKQGLTIERRDNDLNYDPDNCEWIPPEKQSRNRRCVKLLVVGGTEMTRSDASLALGLYKHAINQRVRRGWTLEDAMTRPLRGTK